MLPSKVRKKSVSLVLAGILVLLQASSLSGQTLLVAAASSMRDALEEVAAEFEKASGHKTNFTFGSSGLLAHEIEDGVPYDLYIAAGVNFVQELYHRRFLVQGSSNVICKGRLVIIIRRDSPGKIDRLQDITNFSLIAIANPQHAPYGKAAQEALQNAGLWIGLQNRILYTEQVSDVLELVETGRAAVGIGAESLWASAQVEYVPVEDKLYTPPETYIAMVKGTLHKEEARAFIGFLASDKGRIILKKYGFSTP
ncbi:MAG TPA: molybdate ABC transporter substrate-binding protein [Candidatus Hypogeohydataceae bacterium YC38]